MTDLNAYWQWDGDIAQMESVHILSIRDMSEDEIKKWEDEKGD